MSIGKNIAVLRKEHGLTQAELGERLGVSNQAISKWEQEMNLPDVMMLPKIAKLFGVSVDRLYQEDTSDKEKKRVLRINVDDGNASIQTAIPVESIYAIVKAEIPQAGLPKCTAEKITALEQLKEVFSKSGTLVDTSSYGQNCRIVVEDYED